MKNSSARERTIDAARTLFHEHGFGSVGVAALAKEAGISKRTLYEMFGSKENLLAETISSSASVAARGVPNEQDYPTPRLRISALFHIMEEEFNAGHYCGCLYVNVGSEFKDPANPVVNKAAEQKRRLTAYVARQAKEAGIEQEQAARLAEQITVLHIGAANHALLFGEFPTTTHSLVRDLLDNFHI